MVTFRGVKVHHFRSVRRLRPARFDSGGWGHVPHPENVRSTGHPSSCREAVIPSDDFSICVDKTDRLTQTALEELRASTPAAALAAVVAPPPKWLDQLKFSACLPESIGESVFRARLHLEGLESVWQAG
jgi:hypothetical protein